MPQALFEKHCGFFFSVSKRREKRKKTRGRSFAAIISNRSLFRIGLPPTQKLKKHDKNMKIKHAWTIITISLLLCIGATINVFAGGESTCSGAFWAESSCAEQQEAIDKILHYRLETASLRQDTLSPEEEQKIYPVFLLREEDIRETLKKQAPFSSLISDEIRFILPLESGGHIQYYLNPFEPNADWSAPSFGLAFGASGADNSLIDKKQISQLLETASFHEISDVRYVLSQRYYLTFVYIADASGEWLIPFSSRPDLTGWINGKIYPAQDCLRQLAEAEKISRAEPENNERTDSAPPKSDKLRIILPMTLIVLLIGLGTGIMRSHAIRSSCASKESDIPFIECSFQENRKEEPSNDLAMQNLPAPKKDRKKHSKRRHFQ